MSEERLIRRSRCLAFYFERGSLCCRNYLTGIEVESAAVLVDFLSRLDRWRSPGELERSLPQFTPGSVRSTLKQLIAATLVTVKNSTQDQQERTLDSWSEWGVEARFFHFASKHVTYLKVDDEASLSRQLRERSETPKVTKRYRDASSISLTRSAHGLRDELPRVLLARRTMREFGQGEVALEKISLLLELTWGFTGTIDWPGLGRLPVRTSPSGGARQPIEVYVIARRVDGLPSGWYHYLPDEHGLEHLRRAPGPQRLSDLCGGQRWVGDCAALFVMTAVFPRVMWRYRVSRAYRVVLLEAGHFSQTFCLVATWLGLAPFCTAALDDRALETAMALDGARESVLHAVGVGLPPASPKQR